MKTLILYATKHGAAAEIARRLAARIDGARLHDLKQGKSPDLAEFDCVIAGGSVYAGMLRKEVKEFLSRNVEALLQKKLGLFISGLNFDEEQKVLADNVPAQVLSSAKAAMVLGGIFDPKKAGFAERLIMKAVAKQAEYVNTIDDGRIERLVEALRA